jgi:hypothetical protein
MSTNIEAEMLQRGDTKANWLAKDPVLGLFERVFEIHNGVIQEKVGDGVTKYSLLPYYTGGPSAGGSPFPVTNVDPSYTFINGNTVVTDLRLVGKTGYVVTQTKFNTFFKKNRLQYDAAAGSVTINDFELDDPDDIILIFADVAISAEVSFENILERLAALEKVTAPFKIGTVVIWDKPADQIPEGWVEADEYRGRSFKVVDPDSTNPLFNSLGQNGGSNGMKLTENHLPEIDLSNGEFNRLLKFDGTNTTTPPDNVLSGEEPNLTDSAEILKFGLPEPQQSAIDLNDPFRTVHAIRFTGE